MRDIFQHRRSLL